MTRFILLCFAMLLCVSFTGCGSGGPAEFDPADSEPVTAEEEQEADDYLKKMEEEQKNYKG